jgi:hypothetical protein
MHPQPRMILLLALFALIASPCMFAQQANTSPATAPAATPAVTPSSAPAPAHPQAATCAPKPSETSDPAAANTAPAKKVWTNEDFGTHTAVAPKPAPRGNAHPPRSNANAQKASRANWYHQQIAKLNTQIATIDDQIAKYQSALRGEMQPATGLQEYHIRRANWQTEIDKLQKQREDLETKIAGLVDAARHEGIESGQLD